MKLVRWIRVHSGIRVRKLFETEVCLVYRQHLFSQIQLASGSCTSQMTATTMQGPCSHAQAWRRFSQRVAWLYDVVVPWSDATKSYFWLFGINRLLAIDGSGWQMIIVSSENIVKVIKRLYSTKSTVIGVGGGFHTNTAMKTHLKLRIENNYELSQL